MDLKEFKMALMLNGWKIHINTTKKYTEWSHKQIRYRIQLEDCSVTPMLTKDGWYTTQNSFKTILHNSTYYLLLEENAQ